MSENRVHPTAVVGEDVVLGSGNTIGAFVVVTGPIVLGDDNWIGAHSVIGAPPEIRGYVEPTQGKATPVRIGSRNTIREAAQIHGGSAAATEIGDDCFLMNSIYLAHDSMIGDRVTMASGARLAGHVRVGSDANIGLGALVHQRLSVGTGAIVGMGSVVTRDVPAWTKAYGSPARAHGLNSVGLTRRGLTEPEIAALSDAFTRGDIAGAEEMLHRLA